MSLFNLGDRDKTDPIMRAVKAVNSVAEGARTLSPEDLERQRNAQDILARLITPPVGTTQKDFNIGEMHAAWAIPDTPHITNKVILYCHGGGYTCGSLRYAGILGHKLAQSSGLNTMFFEYRLAPEHPYPVAIQDAIKAWDYLMLRGYGASDIIIAGDSAGGNMALELCLFLREQERMLPGAIVLMSPWTDMTASASTYATYEGIDPIVTKDYVHSLVQAYAGDRDDLDNPKLSPLFADFTDFPPVYIQVGQNEVLLHDSTQLAENMRSFGVSVKIDIFENGWHVFQQLPMPRANTAVKDIGNWIISKIK